jgi:putative membrane protein
MRYVALALVVLVAVEHLWFFALEAYFWDKPLGIKTFRHDPDFAKKSKPLAMNQGLYNGFLAAGLIWSVLAPRELGLHLSIFFLSCVVVAGIVGGITVSKRIALLQAVPAAVALIAVHL